MKKNYNSPISKVVVFQTKTILMTSFTKSETTKGFGESLGRDSGYDFDDEEY